MIENMIFFLPTGNKIHKNEVAMNKCELKTLVHVGRK